MINPENFALITAQSGQDNFLNLLLTTGLSLADDLQSQHCLDTFTSRSSLSETQESGSPA